MAKPDITSKEIGGMTLWDSLGIVASKITIEEITGLTPIGNGNLKSGLVKTIGALALGLSVRKKPAQLIAGGALVDGLEDIFVEIKRSMNIGRNNQSGTTNNGGQQVMVI